MKPQKVRKLLQIELNEVNFNFVKLYCDQGQLPTFKRLINAHGLSETTSERTYQDLEPWIQWVTVHTGKPLSAHKIFRLGDVADRPGLQQIWEDLEERGLTVGAISPMNARNRCENPAFFIPDPWTGGSMVSSTLISRVSEAINYIVNHNAGNWFKWSSFIALMFGIVSLGRSKNLVRYLQLIGVSVFKRWPRALLLDLLLTDIFVHLTRRYDPDFVTLFLNGAAHIQHHHMFDSAVYNGSHRNPDWYRDVDDPILGAYKLYDSLLEQVAEAFPEHRIIILTALRQIPHSQPMFYWRLRNHNEFLIELGINYKKVTPRMSRDFTVSFESATQASIAQVTLSEIQSDDGNSLFDVDNRGNSLFVTMQYQYDISLTQGYWSKGVRYENLREKCAFVAIKNGGHDGTGYLVDTDAKAETVVDTMPLETVYELVVKNFEPG